jgi:hypothetical protein
LTSEEYGEEIPAASKPYEVEVADDEFVSLIEVETDQIRGN